MLPRPSLCLNVPKTGSTYTVRFFNAADSLELGRRARLNRLRLPNRMTVEVVKRIKRHWLEYGNLNCRVWAHHAGYSTLPAGLRHHPKVCTLRDLRTWYCSFYLFYTRSMRDTLLQRAIALLVDGEDRERDERARAIMLRHREVFVERFRGEDASARSIENVSVDFLMWFMETIRTPVMLRTWAGAESWPKEMGFLTFRTITILFEDPKKVFAMEAAEFDAYFASGRYLRDLRCDFFLDFNRLTERLCALMIDELGYRRDIVLFLKEHFGRVNTSPADEKPRILRALDAGGLFARIREREEIYEKYLLPLAGPGTADRMRRT